MKNTRPLSAIALTSTSKITKRLDEPALATSDIAVPDAVGAVVMMSTPMMPAVMMSSTLAPVTVANAAPEPVTPATASVAMSEPPPEKQETLPEVIPCEVALPEVALPEVAPSEVAIPEIVPCEVAPSEIALPEVTPPQVALPAAVPSRPRSLWPRIAFASLGLLLAVGAGGCYFGYAQWRDGGQIAPNIFIHGEPVGGLTRDQAKQRLQNRFGKLFLTIRTPERPYTLSLKELGGEPQIEKVVNHAYWYGRVGDVLPNMQRVYEACSKERRLALPVRWNKARLQRAMWTVNYAYRRPSRDAKLVVLEQGAEVIPHENGRDFNVGDTLQRLQKKYFIGQGTIDATVHTVMPRLTTESLSGQDVRMGEYTTYFDSGLWGRTRNIRIAANQMDGRVLMPGEEYSFNKMTGERTWEKGYRMAHIFERKPGKSESEVVDGLAGGVCQVSSTLYNAVRRTNRRASDGRLDIVERSHHSLPVTYVPYGMDATVAWPSRDFRFRNTFPYPVYLRTRVGGSRLTITVWARVPDNVRAATVPVRLKETASKGREDHDGRPS